MYGRCANPACLAPRHRGDDGKLFRLDIELGSSAGERQRKTAYVWLCGRCARLLSPRVEVADHTVRLLLATIRSEPSSRPPAKVVN